MNYALLFTLIVATALVFMPARFNYKKGKRAETTNKTGKNVSYQRI